MTIPKVAWLAKVAWLDFYAYLIQLTADAVRAEENPAGRILKITNFQLGSAGPVKCK